MAARSKRGEEERAKGGGRGRERKGDFNAD
jgi:hypothetical protein